jgi:hypothetical protein
MPLPVRTPAASTYDTKPNFPPIVDLMGVHPMSVRLLGVSHGYISHGRVL